MDKVQELVSSLDDMAACSERLTKALLGVRDIITGNRKKAESKVTAAKADVPEKAETKPPEPEKPKAKTYTFVEVRQACSAKAHEGYTEQIRAMIAKHGADRLSAVKEEDYAAIMADLETLS